MGALRFGVRLAREARTTNGKEGGTRLLILGAGAAAEALLREIRNNPALHYHPVGLIDDDKHLRSARIHGVSVRGNPL